MFSLICIYALLSVIISNIYIKGWHIMDFKDLAKKRFSCRAFSEKKVDPELIMSVIDTARLAPTAVNNQPYKIWYLKSEEALSNVESVTKCTFGAEHFLVVGGAPDKAWIRPSDSKNFADVDASIIATHIMFAVEDSGLSTTWVGWFNDVALKELYPEMADYELVAIFPIGYAAEDSKPSPRHFLYKDIDEVVKVL